jgi:hypothetical protein
MSYDISNYAMMAISLPEYIDTLKEGVSVEFDSDREFVLLDQKFQELIDKNLPELFKDTEFVKISNIAEGYSEWRGRSGGSYSYRGPRAVCAATIMAAAGIKDPVFFEHGLDLVSNIGNDSYIIPKTLVKHLHKTAASDCETLLGLDSSSPICKLGLALAKLDKINIIHGCNDGKYTFKIPCIKSAIQDLFDLYKGLNTSDYFDNRYYGIEYWIQALIDTLLVQSDIDASLSITSTHYGAAHDLGGMEDNTPYVVYGEMESYDENGWENPRDDDPESFDEVTQVILGNSGKEFRLYTPQFGG